MEEENWRAVVEATTTLAAVVGTGAGGRVETGPMKVFSCHGFFRGVGGMASVAFKLNKSFLAAVVGGHENNSRYAGWKWWRNWYCCFSGQFKYKSINPLEARRRWRWRRHYVSMLHLWWKHHSSVVAGTNAIQQR